MSGVRSRPRFGLTRSVEPLLTVGHGTLPAEDLGALLRAAGVGLLVDVRSFPGSRRHPHVAREAMEAWLPEAGVEYRWDRRLGGRRRPSDTSRHHALRHDAFRAYADHMETEDFAAGLDAVVADVARTTTVVMCAESLWWRCHRRLLADAAALLRGIPVSHLFHDGRLAPHAPTPEARVEDGAVVYDLGETPPLPELA